ncbi:hypothetical protein L596_002616 [Steinernema carpocapsae]|uniref:Uncharacterized protein n=1 Tax=Steinernema carpocapsae TaxID=34508 RepID=A0A4U8UPR0_STECR|nr:hypothetical protein L596_002616 [Steinernema carpocapsae]
MLFRRIRRLFASSTFHIPSPRKGQQIANKSRQRRRLHKNGRDIVGGDAHDVRLIYLFSSPRQSSATTTTKFTF